MNHEFVPQSLPQLPEHLSGAPMNAAEVNPFQAPQTPDFSSINDVMRPINSDVIRIATPVDADQAQAVVDASGLDRQALSDLRNSAEAEFLTNSRKAAKQAYMDYKLGEMIVGEYAKQLSTADDEDEEKVLVGTR